MFITWTENLSVANGAIDQDHKHLIGIINRLHDAIASGCGATIVGETLAELADYTGAHFAREEFLMDRFQYPEAAQHRREHAGLIDQLSVIVDQFEKAGAVEVTGDTMDFLKVWMVNHIQKVDCRLGSFLRQRGGAD